jgi:exodeoxyribonuclease VII large subunit
MMEQAVSVTELNQYISTLMERDEILSYIQVRGEVSNFKRHASGHIYFSLKDAGGVLRAVMFRSDAARLASPIKDGDRVVAVGSVRNYVATGQYQLYVRSITQDGMGALYVAFEALKAKLAKEGLFDESHKRKIPRYPSKIGVVTSPTGAAIRDMLNIIARRFPLAEIELYPALVQGMDAPETLIKGLNYFNSHKPDVIIIGRGGGSIEDLWCFNDEGLARAIFASEVPIISAVGHEIDFTIADFVADLRAPTPSAAAELAVPDRTELMMRLDEIAASSNRLLSQKLRLCRSALNRFDEKALKKSFANFVKDRRLTIQRICERATNFLQNTYALKKNHFALTLEKLEALSPLATLGRGYTITVNSGGKKICRLQDVTEGEVVETILSDGAFTSVVTKRETKE